MGKLSKKDLDEMLTCVKRDRRVIVPPRSGFDSGVHLLENDKCIVISADPCVGVPLKWFGWLLVHYAASDVALFGAKPEFCTITLLGPQSTKSETFAHVMRQVCTAANELCMAIITGHTGTYEELSTLTGVCTAYGVISRNKLLTPSSAKPGDFVYCTKPLGQEVAVNFSLTHKAAATKIFGTEKTRKLENQVEMESCVKEAMLLAKIDGVHAMHDATEGGLITALNEMADASKVGFRIDYENIPLAEGVQELRSRFALSEKQLLSMSSTGTILAAVSPEAAERVENVLRQNGIHPARLGTFTRSTRRILMKNSKETSFLQYADDPYARILSGHV